MRPSTGDLHELLAGQDPVGVVFYRDDAARDDLLGLCELLVGDRAWRRTTSVDDAFMTETRSQVLGIVPINEVEAVRVLDGSREKLLDRKAPAILFLMQGGSAEAELHRQAFALSSFLRGLTYDPEPAVDMRELEEDRRAFERTRGSSPDAWLAAWRRGDVADTEENNLTAHEAWVLRTT